MRVHHRRQFLFMALSVFLVVFPIMVPGSSSFAATSRTPRNHDPGSGTGDSPGPMRLEPILIRTGRPYTAVVSEIGRQGGLVTQQFKYFDGVAAQVPRSALAAIEAITGPDAIEKDMTVEAPRPRDLGLEKAGAPPVIGDVRNIPVESAESIDAGDLQAFAAAQPEGYRINDGINNSSPLHAEGITGAGVIVGIIDSGIRPNYPHITLDGSVIGGEDFVRDGRGYSNSANSGHGTFVAGLISANVVFGFNTLGVFFRAVQAYAPGAIIPPNRIPMLGSAPLSSLYILRVFGPFGGAPVSRILQAIDRAIELRVLHDAGLPGGVKIQVVNMSLSGPTLFAGRDLLDRAVSALLDHDIVAVASAGNAGPAGLTIGGPGSSLGAITVGAASLAHNERIVRDVQFGLGIGGYFRPSSGTQTAYYSSRGPDADGRGDPDVIANGDWSYGQGFTTPTFVDFGAGTSFSSPTVAGVAALLRQAVPSATARQVHNAIITSANAGLLADDSGFLDQGAGYVDALAARNLLRGGAVPDALPAPPPYAHKVRDNVTDNTGLAVLSGAVTQHVGPLKPGQRGELLYQVQPSTSHVLLTLSNVTPLLPPEQQNVFFGDDVLLAVHTAKTSRQANAFGDGDYLVYAFTLGGTGVFEDPEPGLMRITVHGDWTNAGGVSADVSLVSFTDAHPRFTRQGKVGQSDQIAVPVSIGPGISTAEFRLIFREDWSNYPASDIDLILIRPDGSQIFSGATLDDPELVVVNNPMPGTWTAVIDGFEVHVGDDKYELRVTLDGSVVR